MPADLTPAEKLRMLAEMYRIRHFEDECSLRYCRGMDMGGWLIQSTGQEGTPVAVRALMGPDDHTISGPRGLAPAIASGMPLTSIMAEFFGRATGCSAGKGGQFSLYSPEHRHWGSYATAAAQTPVAAGLAYALKSRGQRGAVFCYLGEGAVNQGVFHETLNLAGLFHLPVVFVIENNGFAMGTHTSRGSAYRGHLARRAEGYDIARALAEGWDIPGVMAAVRDARTRAVEDSRPTVLEVQCYRFRGFTIADANTYRYRTREEVEWQKEHRDPIQCWATASARTDCWTRRRKRKSSPPQKPKRARPRSSPKPARGRNAGLSAATSTGKQITARPGDGIFSDRTHPGKPGRLTSRRIPNANFHHRGPGGIRKPVGA